MVNTMKAIHSNSTMRLVVGETGSGGANPHMDVVSRQSPNEETVPNIKNQILLTNEQ